MSSRITNKGFKHSCLIKLTTEKLYEFGRKVITNLDNIFKSKDIILPTKVRLVKAMVFPVVMYGCEFGLCRRLSAEELLFLNCGVGEDS